MNAITPTTTQTQTQTLALAGMAADAAASKVAFSDYRAGASANTLRAQAGDLAHFCAFLQSVGVKDYPDCDELMQRPEAWQGVTPGLVLAFREYQMQQGYAVGTVNRQLATVKVYARLAGIDTTSAKGFGHKQARNRDEKRTEEGTATRKGSKKAQSIHLTRQQAKTLKSQPDTSQGRRDALLMALLLDHGLRCGEVALLKVEDFDMQAGILRFYRPKVGKVQRHKLTPDTLKGLQAYAQDMPTSGHLLRGSIKGGALAGEGMSERAITARVKELGERIDIEGLSAHDCRHYWATAATQAGTHPRHLQQAGGWNSPAMVYRYVAETEIANEGVIL